jgi:hypothetical protein
MAGTLRSYLGHSCHSTALRVTTPSAQAPLRSRRRETNRSGTSWANRPSATLRVPRAVRQQRPRREIVENPNQDRGEVIDEQEGEQEEDNEQVLLRALQREHNEERGEGEERGEIEEMEVDEERVEGDERERIREIRPPRPAHAHY